MGENGAIDPLELLHLGDLDAAGRIADSVIERCGDQGCDSQLWQARFVHADVMRLRGQPEQALSYLDKSYSSNTPETGDAKSTILLKMHRGYYLGLMGRYREAHSLLADAEALSSKAKLVEPQAEIGLRRAMIFFRQKDYGASDRAYRTVLELSDQLGGWYFPASALWGIGKNLMIQRNYEQAMPWLSNAAAIFETAGARLSTAIVWGEIGVCQLGLGNDAEALELFERAAEEDQNIGAVHNYQVILANIGNVYLHRRAFLTALSYYQKALALASEIKDSISVEKWTYNIRLAYAMMRAAADQQYPASA